MTLLNVLAIVGAASLIVALALAAWRRRTAPPRLTDARADGVPGTPESMSNAPLSYFAPAPGELRHSRAGVSSFVHGCIGWASFAAAQVMLVTRPEGGPSDRDMYMVGLLLLAAAATLAGITLAVKAWERDVPGCKRTFVTLGTTLNLGLAALFAAFCLLL
jgi:hypothetical protein